MTRRPAPLTPRQTAAVADLVASSHGGCFFCAAGTAIRAGVWWPEVDWGALVAMWMEEDRSGSGAWGMTSSTRALFVERYQELADDPGRVDFDTFAVAVQRLEEADGIDHAVAPAHEDEHGIDWSAGSSDGTDRFGRSFADVLPWREAQTLAEFAELTARWLEGTSTYIPGYLSTEPAPETQELIPDLVSFNRAGLWTHGSQPGLLEDGWAQRAYLDGLCDETLAQDLDALSVRSDLIVLVHRPGSDVRAPVGVTAHNGCVMTRAGAALSVEEMVELGFYVLSEEGRVALRSAWRVTVIDPRWGRNDLLWPEVRRTVTSWADN